MQEKTFNRLLDGKDGWDMGNKQKKKISITI